MHEIGLGSVGDAARVIGEGEKRADLQAWLGLTSIAVEAASSELLAGARPCRDREMWNEPDCRFKVSNCARDVVFLIVREAAAVQRKGIFGVELYRRVQVGDGFAIVAAVKIGLSAIVISQSVI